MALAGMDILTKQYDGNFAAFVEDYKEANKITAKQLKDSKDWRTMSEDEWKKTLESFDKYVEAWQEEMDRKIEKQQEAGEKAALKAPPGMRSIAASQAMLAVAASGFYTGNFVGTETEPVEEEEGSIDHEKNWTKRLKTDDQLIFRMAKEAQTAENDAMRAVSMDTKRVHYMDGESSEVLWDKKFRNEYI